MEAVLANHLLTATALARVSDVSLRCRKGTNAWHMAAGMLSKAFLELLLPFTPDVDVRTVPGVATDGRAYARTALHAAAHYGSHECCYFLVKNRASPTAVDSRGMTPLHNAAMMARFYIYAEGIWIEDNE
jgi:hypothetical protein